MELYSCNKKYQELYLRSNSNGIPKRLILVTLAAVMAVTPVVPYAALNAPIQAWADETSPEMPNLIEMQEKVDAASAVYNEVSQRVSDIETQIFKTTNRIKEINGQIPEAKKRSDRAAAEYYRLISTSNVFLDVIFSAETMGDFFANLEYSERMHQGYLNEIKQLYDLNSELQTAQDKLEDNKRLVEEERTKAEEALKDAQRARDEAEETARRIAEETAAATAAAAAAAAADGHTPSGALPPNGAGGSYASSPEGEYPSATGQTDKQAFVNQWSGRIDAYLAGSPMEGKGWVFANAAFDYDVDPRWSPAISCMESSKGRYCFRQHNAWGWGQIDWPDWDTAIYEHVRGLSRGYGHNVTLAAAQKYCPPNYVHWFDTVSAQMRLI
jgi:peptidoglycan hydrolase CwlO-like protein